MMELPPPLETVEICDGEQPRKLAILGLPWDTSDETLRSYFTQFGGLEHAEIMKDRYSGKSRGFGFVTFVDATAAQQALLTDHTIDGRRCEAKIALPKGEPTPPRTTRIFVARVPPSVSEAQFRVYFETFGKLQDAYMPRDHSKQGFRGIGFVTYACPESVEKVMAVKHWMHGHEIAIDRATPKDEPAISRNMLMTFQRPGGGSQRRSFDNGAGIIGPGLTSVMQMNSGLSTIGEGPAEYPVLSSLSVDCDMLGERDLHVFQAQSMSNHDLSTEMPSMQPMVSHRWSGQIGQQEGQAAGTSNSGISPTDAAVRARQALGISLGDMGLHNRNAAAAVAASAALQTLANVQSAAVAADSSSAYNAALTQLQGLNLGLTDDQRAGLLFSSISKAASPVHAGMLQDMSHHPTMQQYMAAQHVASSNTRRSIDNSVINMSRRSIGENPAIATARAGPRIFIGKLTKDTTEADVKEYFMRFGYVMDVYLPKSKDNKAEHRGFGFVTFETEAAIQRVVSNGSHRLRGSTIAIDIAMPKVDEESEGNDSSGGRNSFDSVPFVTQPGNINPALVGLGAPLPIMMAHNI